MELRWVLPQGGSAAGSATATIMREQLLALARTRHCESATLSNPEKKGKPCPTVCTQTYQPH